MPPFLVEMFLSITTFPGHKEPSHYKPTAHSYIKIPFYRTQATQANMTTNISKCPTIDGYIILKPSVTTCNAAGCNGTTDARDPLEMDWIESTGLLFQHTAVHSVKGQLI